MTGADVSLGEQNFPRLLPKFQVAEVGQIGGAKASDQSCEAQGQILSYFMVVPWITTPFGSVQSQGSPAGPQP